MKRKNSTHQTKFFPSKLQSKKNAAAAAASLTLVAPALSGHCNVDNNNIDEDNVKTETGGESDGVSFIAIRLISDTLLTTSFQREI